MKYDYCPCRDCSRYVLRRCEDGLEPTCPAYNDWLDEQSDREEMVPDDDCFMEERLFPSVLVEEA